MNLNTETEPESYCAWSPTSGLLVTWDNTFFFSLIQFEVAFLVTWNPKLPNLFATSPRLPLQSDCSIPETSLHTLAYTLLSQFRMSFATSLYLGKILHKQNHECLWSAPGPPPLWSLHWPLQPCMKFYSMLCVHHFWCFLLSGPCAHLLN